MKITSAIRVLAVAGFVTACGAGAALAADEPKNEAGILLGFGFPDKEFVGESKDYRPNLLLGLRLAHLMENERLAWFLDGTVVPYNGATSLGDVRNLNARTGLEYLFSPEKTDRWFLSGAVGWMGFYPDFGDDFSRGMVSLGVGRRYQQTENRSFRWELRADQSVYGSSGLNDEDVLNAQFLMGLSWGAASIPKDDDGDGVPNKKDQCPGTPAGCIVDEVGCPRDADGDGVCDGLDRCPNTPKDCSVDGNGCPVDTDGDGVCDKMDTCPDTAKSCKVDAKGCPSDADGDGVCDGVDQCANTVKGCKVDAKGCPVDGDKDGVCDGLDQCLGTPAGDKVDAKGCSLPKEEAIVIKPQEVLVLEGALFEFNSAELAAAPKATLDKVARGLKANPDVKIEVGGHTDSKGGNAYNQKLSEKRAQAVADYLTAQGVPSSQLTVKGFGETRPTATNDTEEGRARNRRVELKRP
jgi:outer membrane protein OmpA-like peptidoglycan-associated protein